MINWDRVHGAGGVFAVLKRSKEVNYVEIREKVRKKSQSQKGEEEGREGVGGRRQDERER